MKATEKILRYILVFIIIAVVVYIFTERRSLKIENFESSGMSWWVWLIIVLVGIIIMLVVMRMMNTQKQKQEISNTFRRMNENKARRNATEKRVKANQEAYRAELDAAQQEGGVRSSTNKGRK